jgi:hypothetical protein
MAISCLGNCNFNSHFYLSWMVHRMKDPDSTHPCALMMSPKTKQIGDHALPQEGFGLGTPKGRKEGGRCRVHGRTTQCMGSCYKLKGKKKGKNPNSKLAAKL